MLYVIQFVIVLILLVTDTNGTNNRTDYVFSSAITT